MESSILMGFAEDSSWEACLWGEEVVRLLVDRLEAVTQRVET